MKFLVDAQLPPKLCEIFNMAELNAIHVDSLPKKDKTPDKDILQYADEQGMIVVSKDFDFYQSHIIHGKPKRLLLVATGNIKNRELFDLIRMYKSNIKNLFANCNFVELRNDGILGNIS